MKANPMDIMQIVHNRRDQVSELKEMGKIKHPIVSFLGFHARSQRAKIYTQLKCN